MELLLSHISYLLGEHRIVPVSGLGTFVRVEQSAVFTRNGITAPRSRIEFINEIDPHSERILEASIARSLKLPMAEVRALIDEEVSTLSKVLYGGDKVEIAGVGTLSFNNGSFDLIPSADPGSSASEWYANLNVESLVQEEEPQAVVPTAGRETFLRSLSRTASSAAGVAVLILITFITSQLPGRKGASEATYASFGVETTAITPTEALIPRPASTVPAVVLVVNTPPDGVIEVLPQEDKVQFADSDPYVLVVASLANEREVERFMKAHESENLGLLTADNRLRVFAATGTSIKELKTSATEKGLYERYPNAWIWRR